LYWDKAGRHLYAVSETADRPRVYSYLVDAHGHLSLETSLPTSGAAPCHLAITPVPDRLLLVTNYSGATVDWFSLNDQGVLGPRQGSVVHAGRSVRDDRQDHAHPHSAWIDPDGQHVIVPDLGQDALFIYRLRPESSALDAVGRVNTPSGSGPRHLVFHPNGRYLYTVNELDSSVQVYAYEAASAQLTLEQTISALPPEYHGASDAAHVAISVDGSHLYVSNRGHDSIAVFRVEQGGARLTAAAFHPVRAAFPRHFALSPDGSWLIVAGQKQNLIEVFPLVDGIPGPSADTMALAQPTYIAVG
jgi:6-phosphogluconolactonase